MTAQAQIDRDLQQLASQRVTQAIDSVSQLADSAKQRSQIEGCVLVLVAQRAALAVCDAIGEEITDPADLIGAAIYMLEGVLENARQPRTKTGSS
ncbi:hypothetical protein [Roseibium sp. RKSG952]|uniref:hypothetical protein n=1 Tax=Roseibium sp. RKSG952 TaxID=2529384 RepID=UPI0012BC020C|nr:hypothetical protein [Roseibium sp. RKSG952]MTH95106.1 hypothetical protein [Roseibium sp. RKSG952]